MAHARVLKGPSYFESRPVLLVKALNLRKTAYIFRFPFFKAARIDQEEGRSTAAFAFKIFSFAFILCDFFFLRFVSV